MRRAKAIRLFRTRFRASATVFGLACFLTIFSPLAQAQTGTGYGSNDHASSDSVPLPCAAIWIESRDPWIRTVDLRTRILMVPEFVNSGMAISRDAEHADLSIQLAVSIDDGETKFDYLIASSAKAKLRDQVSFKWPAEDYEEVVARKAVTLLLAHCSATTSKAVQPPQLPQELVKEKLISVRFIRPIVRTSWMTDEVLLSALRRRPEFAEWGIKIGSLNKGSDLNLVVGHVLSTITWTFQLIDSDSGALLDQGSVMAFNDDRAAIRIVSAAIKQISLRRPIPAPVLGSGKSHVADYRNYREAWMIEAASEDLQKRFPGEMHLSIENGSLIVESQEQNLFSIKGESIIDFADTKSFDTWGDKIRLTADRLDCDAGCLPFLLAYGMLVSILDHFHIPLQIFEIAWFEDKTMRVASFRVSKGNYQDLLSQLELLCNVEAHDSP